MLAVGAGGEVVGTMAGGAHWPAIAFAGGKYVRSRNKKGALVGAGSQLASCGVPAFGWVAEMKTSKVLLEGPLYDNPGVCKCHR